MGILYHLIKAIPPFSFHHKNYTSWAKISLLPPSLYTHFHFPPFFSLLAPTYESPWISVPKTNLWCCQNHHILDFIDKGLFGSIALVCSVCKVISWTGRMSSKSCFRERLCDVRGPDWHWFWGACTYEVHIEKGFGEFNYFISMQGLRMGYPCLWELS